MWLRNVTTSVNGANVRARPQTSMLLHYVNCLPPANSAWWRMRWYAISWLQKTNSSRIRERLLLEVPLDLRKAVTVTQHIETATAEAKAMITSSDNSVQAVQQHNRFRRSNSKVNTSRGPPKCTRARTCYRCGSEQHTAIFPDALLRMLCAGTVTKQDILQRYVVETNGWVKLRYLKWLW